MINTVVLLWLLTNIPDTPTWVLVVLWLEAGVWLINIGLKIGLLTRKVDGE